MISLKKINHLLVWWHFSRFLRKKILKWKFKIGRRRWTQEKAANGAGNN